MQLLECNCAIIADPKISVAPEYFEALVSCVEASEAAGQWGDWSSCPGKLLLCQTFPQLAEYNFTKCDSDTSPNVSQSFPIDFLTIFVLSGKGTWPKGIKVVDEFVKLCPKVPSNFLFCSGTSPDDGQCRTGCDGTGCQCSSALPIHTQVI